MTFGENLCHGSIFQGCAARFVALSELGFTELVKDHAEEHQSGWKIRDDETLRLMERNI